MWRLIYAIPMWILMAFLKVLLILVGHFVIPPLLWFGLRRGRASGESAAASWPWMHTSKAYGADYAGFPKWAYLWANEGDGVLGPPEYFARFELWSEFRRAWMWSAIRNPVNNLRFVPGLSCRIDPARVRFVGSASSPADFVKLDQSRATYWFFSWCGMYSGFRVVYRRRDRLVKFWIGWKIWPQDQLGVSEYRRYRAGFAMQWRYF